MTFVDLNAPWVASNLVRRISGAWCIFDTEIIEFHHSKVNPTFSPLLPPLPHPNLVSKVVFFQNHPKNLESFCTQTTEQLSVGMVFVRRGLYKIPSQVQRMQDRNNVVMPAGQPLHF